MGIAYNTSTVRDGLVLHLDAANVKSYPGSGTVWKDLSGSGNNGTLVNGVGYSADNFGTMTFDGVNDYIQVSNSSSINPSEITLICWAKSTTSTWNSSGMLMSKRDVFVLHPNSGTTTITYYVRLNGSTYLSSGSIGVPDIQQWNMYAFTWTAPNKLTSYLNGEFVKNNFFTGTTTTNDTGPLFIGWDDGLTGRYFNGNIPQCSMYNRPLSADEIRQNFEALRGRYGI